MIIILITFPFYSSNKILTKYQKSNSLRRALYRSRTHRSQAEIHQSQDKATTFKRRWNVVDSTAKKNELVK